MISSDKKRQAIYQGFAVLEESGRGVLKSDERRMDVCRWENRSIGVLPAVVGTTKISKPTNFPVRILLSGDSAFNWLRHCCALMTQLNREPKK